MKDVISRCIKNGRSLFYNYPYPAKLFYSNFQPLVRLYFFQGNFTHWLDGSPLHNTDWNSKQLAYQWPDGIALYKYVNGKYFNVDNFTINIMSVLQLTSRQEQPVYDLSENCTGVFTFTGCRPRGWVVIPCKQKFYTTFVCVSHYRNKVKTNYKSELNPSFLGVSTKLVCPEGWLLISEKCVKFKQLTFTTSFSEADDICRLEDSRLLSIKNIMPLRKTKFTNIRVLSLFSDYISYITSKVCGFESFFNYKKLSEQIIGIPFLYDKKPEELSHVEPILNIFRDMTGFDVLLPIIETSTNSCWILEYSFWQAHHMKIDKAHGELVMALKPRLCFISFQITPFVCERTPNSLNSTCITGHFTCVDKTCILSIYVCDTVSDCMHGEDEVECPDMNYTTNSFFDTLGISIPMIPCTKNMNNVSKIEWITYDHIHSFCDGIYDCNIIDEKLCSHGYMKPIHVSQRNSLEQKELVRESLGHKYVEAQGLISILQHTLIDVMNTRQLNKSSSTVKTLFKCGFNFLKELAVTNITVHNSSSEIDSDLTLSCPETTYSHTIYDYCTISSEYPCGYGRYSLLCRHIDCPGMFKCKSHACIRLSSMCDGYIDCPLAEDEFNCLNISCPGLLKCRQENRCIGLDQLCDGSRDCTNSFDDEVLCTTCPPGCICMGYTITCVDIETNIYNISFSFDAKAIILKGAINTLSLNLHNIETKNIVLIDISFCQIHRIIFHDSNRMSKKTNVFSLNVSGNNFRNDSMLLMNIFRNIMLINFSSNFLTSLRNSSFFNLKHLSILNINDNPISYIKFSSFLHLNNLLALSIKGIYILKDNIRIDMHDLYNSFQILTDDPLLCCCFPSNFRCITPFQFSCYGLIPSFSNEVIITCLAISSFTFAFLITGKYILFLIRQSKRNIMLPVLINMGISENLLSAYIISILIANNHNVNIVYWQRGNICKVLHACFVMTLVSNIMLRTTATLVLCLKIIYPYRHQCRWLQSTWFISISIWLIVILVCINHIISLNMFYSHNVFCTYWCQGADKLVHLKVVVSLLELFCIVLLVACTLIIENTLTKSEDFIKLGGNTKVNYASKVVLPLAVETVVELLFRFSSIILFILEILPIINLDNACMIFVGYIIPLKSIISLSARQLKK